MSLSAVKYKSDKTMESRKLNAFVWEEKKETPSSSSSADVSRKEKRRSSSQGMKTINKNAYKMIG